MICKKCQTEMSVKKASKNEVVFTCRNPKCPDYKKEHKQSR